MDLAFTKEEQAFREEVRQFLSGRTKLDLPACLQLVDQAICILEGIYVHLPLKRAMYAVDPVRHSDWARSDR